MNAYSGRYPYAMLLFVSCILVASLAMAQDSTVPAGAGGAEPSSNGDASAPSAASAVITGQKAPVQGEFRPAPQADPTRIVALVPVVDVPGGNGAKAPLFLEDRESPAKPASERVKTDASKAEVPVGIIAFRAMYSDDGEWALVDLEAREASALERVRSSSDSRVRIFTAAELDTGQMRAGPLPAGLSLAQFLEP